MKKYGFLALMGLCLLGQVFSGPQKDGDLGLKLPSFPGTLGSDVSDALSILDKTVKAATDEPTPEDEYYIGRAVAANILSVYKPYTGNPELTRYLNRICQTLAVNSPQPEIYNGYHVIILDSPEFNAFASPGGHILVTRGLVEAAPSEDALAGVIAHELAHILLKHSVAIIKDMRVNEALSDAGKKALEIAAREANLGDRTLLFSKSISEVVDVMVKNGYSQSQEFEADDAAVALLAAAGYDPGGLLEMLKALQRVQGSQKGGFNSTHPSPAKRIANADKATGNFSVEDTRSYRVPRFKNK